MFSIRNATMVALMQVGVIVIGVLGSGIWHRFAAVNGMRLPDPVIFVYAHGVIGLLIPLVWIAVALSLSIRPEVSDPIKVLSQWVGVLVLIALILLVFYADVSPFFHVMWRMNGDDAG